ncbi:MAG: hypothetical protein UU67_C0079G0008 [Candidatus Daviesbacteria bacterium GW2011_GWB1_41_5]|uniref:Lipoprotein n=1 Tax=Candidatus Daviesbacteria bacterium GW2011_GWB1_41_5 TaxID=1618429 RepID=A0A0G0YNR7_9BACT|nr:MAG: hypothetical protein UU67_C0079G0008 [Candidatus Daviesbacteria bacterium GW2011_GWB1_41_5]
MAKKIIFGIIGLLVVIVIISGCSPKSKESFDKGKEAGKATANQQSQTQENKTPQQIFEEIGKKTSDKSSVLAQEEDGQWVVINTLTGGSELGLSGAKSLARDFIFGVYASGLPINQAGITIASDTGKYYRAYVGANQAKLESPETWSKPSSEVGPTIFYDWLKKVQTGRNDEDLANSTYLETNLE